MAVDNDLVLSQLRKLREGPGLSVDRLAASGSLMSALATSDPLEGLERLLGFLEELDDGERTRALKVDFGLDLERLLGRAPMARERDWLGDRRAGFAEVVGRDVKTVARWSDRAVAELRGKLLADTFRGHLYVVATVRGERIVGCSLVQQDEEEGESRAIERRSVDYQNPAEGPSLPCLVYGYPRDWRPKTLTLAVAFVDMLMPSEVWAVMADSFFGICFGEDRHALTPVDGVASCKFVNPRRNQLYGVWWRS